MSEYEVTGQRGTLIDSAYVVHRKDAVESIAHCVDVVRAEWLAAALNERDLLLRQVEALATSLTEAANELVPYGGYSYHIEKWREQIKQVKKGGGGE